jgi:prepilin-type processing-associated H-X9-DG protein
VNRTNGGAYDFTSANNDATYGSLGSGEVYAFHPGGANVALGDGSARLINRNTPIAVFARLVTRSGGEEVEVDSNQ